MESGVTRLSIPALNVVNDLIKKNGAPISYPVLFHGVLLTVTAVKEFIITQNSNPGRITFSKELRNLPLNPHNELTISLSVTLR